MENTIVRPTQSAVDNIDWLEIFFYRYYWVSDGYPARATYDYQRCFGIQEVLANHCAIRLGNLVYEISTEGMTCIDYDEYAREVVSDRALTYLYSCDLSELPIESRLQARFILDNDVTNDRKLNCRDCLKYLGHWFYHCLRPDLQRFRLDFNVGGATIKRGSFHLPYTCATQAAYTLSRLFGLEITVDSHLPTTLVYICDYLDSVGVGSLMEL